MKLIDEIVTQNVRLYLTDLKTHIYANPNSEHLINALFFPEKKIEILQWLSGMNVLGFGEYLGNEYLGQKVYNRILSAKELDADFFGEARKSEIERYDFFDKIECNTFEEVKKKYPLSYYIVKKDYVRRIDNLFFSRLDTYIQVRGNSEIWEKTISTDLTIRLSTEREPIDSIIGYRFPTVSIIYKGDVYIVGSADISTFLFLPANSFLFFYNESISYDLKGDPPISIENVMRKKDEPVVYSNENGYTITNSWGNIDRYNTYIDVVTNLSVYYFRFWESWLTKIFGKNN